MLADEVADEAAAEADYEATWHMIDVLEERELTETDVSAELLTAEPPERLGRSVGKIHVCARLEIGGCK